MASPTSPDPQAHAPSGEADDHDLIRHIKQGSPEALDLLIARHRAWIYNIVLPMVTIRTTPRTPRRRFLSSC